MRTKLCASKNVLPLLYAKFKTRSQKNLYFIKDPVNLFSKCIVMFLVIYKQYKLLFIYLSIYFSTNFFKFTGKLFKFCCNMFYKLCCKHVLFCLLHLTGVIQLFVTLAHRLDCVNEFHRTYPISVKIIFKKIPNTEKILYNKKTENKTPFKFFGGVLSD